MAESLPPFASREGAAVLVRLKAVPGASRDGIAGLLGDRLKVRVAAPPEGGRANEAIVGLLATSLGVSRSSVAIVQGHATPLKSARIETVCETVIERLKAIASA